MRTALILLQFVFVISGASLAYSGLKSTAFRDIPDGSVMEGSLGHGGFQPDYIIDKNHPALAPLWDHARNVKSLPQEDKIRSIVQFIRTVLLPNRNYEDKDYLRTLKQFRELKREIPLGEYAVAKAGVCREYALLTHLALKEAGVPNQYVYAKVNTGGLIEDHAFTVIKDKGQLITVDSYELDYSGRLLKDLMNPGGITDKSYRAPWGRAKSGNYTVAVLDLHEFPKVFSLAPEAVPEIPPSTRSRAVSIKVGPELTFTNENMLNANWSMPNGDVTAVRAENKEALERYKIKIQELCLRKGCKIEEQFHVWSDGWRTPELRVTYPDGWWFIAGLDTSVLEFQSKEMTLKDLDAFHARIQQDIFDACEELGLKPKPGVGGGHIHIDLTSAFPEDGRLLRDFLVDYSNHPGLAFGALSLDQGNATPVAKLRSDQKIAFRKVISDFDYGLIRGRNQLAKEIERRVYFHSPVYGDPSQKYMAVNLTRVTKENVAESFRTVELRALRAQRNADDLKKIADLFEGRINYLKNLPDRVLVGTLLPPTDDAEVLKQYRSYVRGAGLDPDLYLDLIPARYRGSQSIKSKTRCKEQILRVLFHAP
ncbi:MAG: hypothetical protein A2Z97_01105 [Bdellovibrionales bacterium GWB1_52_6]|nr:MAG: hypothetical protein A2Z97_01105 [Bdellovibrionales bacterium GWB1_52_6]OFZ03597.1 MAG: hypothetical protein A2X97_00695 [Bdellovibrionales bacterium GWA1_52_35]HCM38920.1 hypothetical protein [Bdellovibrionales bacterium]